jgi:hypothetical protein
MTLNELSTMTDQEVERGLELDPAKAIENIKARLGEFEAKYKIPTTEMVAKTDVEDYCCTDTKEWLWLYAALRELEANPSPSV